MMGVQQNIEEILGKIPAGSTHQDRLHKLAGMERFHRHEVVLHASNVADTAARIAAAIGVSQEDCRAIHEATLLHDIGKLAIPSEVLHKNGPPDPYEREVLNMHTVAGVELLGPEASQLMVDITKYHHERYDGFGYENLKGEEIPLAARIVTVADVHDALMRKREYKDDMPEEEALEKMTRDVASPGFGRRLFDPFLLRRFVAMRLSDPEFQVSAERRTALSEYALSDPMSDLADGPATNGGWTVRKTGHRVLNEKSPNGNDRMVEMRLPNGSVKFSARTAAPADDGSDYDPAGFDYVAASPFRL